MPASSMPTVDVVRSERDLEQIVALQAKNVVATADGFVTVRHTLAILRAMHDAMPSIVARNDAGDVVAYALAMPREASALLPVLATMFARLDRNAALTGKRWYVMGQVCVDESVRGTGVFDALYAEHRARFHESFDRCVTEIATRNGRSMRAHARVGFVEIDRYRDDTDEWSVVSLDLHARAAVSR